MTTLKIESLTKRFNEVTAVNSMNLEIAEGELVALLGPSGCGKTTTLRCIGGFEEPDEGKILFDDVNVVGLLPEKRSIGMVFQNYALFPHMTVFQNIAFGLQMKKRPKVEIQSKVLNVLETVQLTGFEERYPRQLSGGQQQRVALARAIVIEPKVLLLDEPLANLDAKLREEMRFFIRSLQKRVGITTVYVTHDQSEAMVIADRIVVMFNGIVEQTGNPSEIYANPVSKQVADFIGLSNFIDSEVISETENKFYRLQTKIGEIDCKYEGRLQKGEKVIVAVRPESISLSKEKKKEGNINVLPGTIKERSYLGNLYDYKIRCADSSTIRIQEDPWKIFNIGEDIWFSFSPGHAWIIHEKESKANRIHS
jgi:spermidine/putrescine ABC transporter ATP-binding subunit